MNDLPASIDRDFVNLVAQYVRGDLPEKFKELFDSPEDANRVYDALVSLKKDVEYQLSSYKARMNQKRAELIGNDDGDELWIEYKAKEAEWRARVTKFLKSLEDHIMAAKQKKREAHEQHGIPRLAPTATADNQASAQAIALP